VRRELRISALTHLKTNPSQSKQQASVCSNRRRSELIQNILHNKLPQINPISEATAAVKRKEAEIANFTRKLHWKFMEKVEALRADRKIMFMAICRGEISLSGSHLRCRETLYSVDK